MTITFLGTSAANAYPIAFCACANCERARELGGPSLRRRSSALINDDMLIDLGPDIMTGAFAAGRSLTSVEFCLQTHAHSDHLDPSHFLSRSPEFLVEGAPKLHFYASRETLRRASEHFQGFHDASSLFAPGVGERLNLEMHEARAAVPIEVGPYRVTGVAANHDESVQSLLYAVERDGQCVFYGADTSVLPEETWRGFHKCGLRFDTVILDHTYGPGLPSSDHLSADGVIETMARMRADGLLASGARVFGTHISHEGNPPHPELAAFAARHGYEIAYDGLTV